MLKKASWIGASLVLGFGSLAGCGADLAATEPRQIEEDGGVDATPDAASPDAATPAERDAGPDSSADAAAECADDATCGTTCGSWGSCDYRNTCDETAVQRRSCTREDGSHFEETRACERDTDGLSCGGPICEGGFGACEFDEVCAEQGVQTRSCDVLLCGSGSCNRYARPNYEERICSRQVSDPSCGSSGGPENCAGTAPSTWEMDDKEVELLGLINAERRRRGLGSLAMCRSLGKAAQKHSAWMRDTGSWGHSGPPPDDVQFWHRMCNAGYSPGCDLSPSWPWPSVAAGETIAVGFEPRDPFGAWMNSAGHREILMDAKYTVIGIGHACGTHSVYEDYWTADLAEVGHSSCE